MSEEMLLTNMLIGHDWYFHMSDDSNAFAAGDQSRQRLTKYAAEFVDQEKARELWTQYAPVGFKFPVKEAGKTLKTPAQSFCEAAKKSQELVQQIHKLLQQEVNAGNLAMRADSCEWHDAHAMHHVSLALADVVRTLGGQ